jgi:minor histocompatibility antigen H13
MTLSASPFPVPLAHIGLLLVALAPLVIDVPTDVNIILTASITVFCGAWRSVKPEPPAESMTKKVIM